MRSRGAPALVHGHVHLPETFLLSAVVILCHRIAGLVTGIDKGLV